MQWFFSLIKVLSQPIPERAVATGGVYQALLEQLFEQLREAR